jgi:antitoxin component YwqK of YwqJK toxin-antitoxin module
MNFKLAALISLITLTGTIASAQVNMTDATGKKQGPWIKKYQNGNILYQGNFKDDKPTGEFKRYYEDGTSKAVLLYDATGITAIAVFYHPDGKKAAEGTYIAQKKEGKWKYYSAIQEGYLVSEDNYVADVREGLSTKFYISGSVAETLPYHEGIKDGEWIQYYADGKPCLKATYVKGMLEGTFLFYFPEGSLQFEGFYLADKRNGKWKTYNEDGTLKYEIEYLGGKPTDPTLAEKETKLLDELEKNKGKILDPEMTGNEEH